jgi:RNA polymerase sigma-70 factor (ECF subfamily)
MALDEGAWIRRAVDEFEVPLTQYASRLLSGDVDRARDVVQDTFLKLWTADRASVDGHLGQWLYRVCRNRALDVRRKESRMTALQDQQLDHVGTSAPAPRRSGSLHDDALTAGTPGELPGPAVMELLESLNETQQEALRLKFQGGLSYKEIAAVLDITSNHVGVLIHHAIKTLRERMAASLASAPAGSRAPGRVQA